MYVNDKCHHVGELFSILKTWIMWESGENNNFVFCEHGTGMMKIVDVKLPLVLLDMRLKATL